VNAFVQLQSKSDRAAGAKGEQICAPQTCEAHIKQGLTGPALNRKVSTAVPQPAGHGLKVNTFVQIRLKRSRQDSRNVRQEKHVSAP